MAVNIGPVIGIDGEKEFRKQINQCVQATKTLDSEMKALTSSFDDNDQSQEKLTKQAEILSRQIENQEERISLLQRGLDEASKKYGENDTKTQKWAQAVYDATAQLNRMTSELDDVTNTMARASVNTSDLEDAMDDAAGAADDLSDSAEETGLSFNDLLGADLVSNAVSYMADTIRNAAEETREYRKIMASLEVSSEKAGYTARQTAETYETLYGVLGDDQTAATTTANLQALGLAQSDLRDITNATIGAWATYGDSIPIDSLSEAINETAQTGTVTGTFADVLNWAGESEDAFNQELQSTNDVAERTRKILRVMTKQGLEQAGEAWQENNKTLVEANKATAEQQEALAKLGETVEPILTDITELTTDLFGFIADNGSEIITIVSGVGAAFAGWKVTDALTSATGGWSKLVGAITSHPLETAVAGIAGLVTAAVVAADQFGGASERIQSEMDGMTQAGESMKETAEGFDGAMSDLEASTSKMEASGVYAGNLADRLDELAGTTNRTSTEQAEMESIVERLNTLFPDLGLEIDDVTGELNMSTDAVSDFVKEASEIEKLETIQKHYSDAVAEVTEMEISKAEAEIALAEAGGKLEELDKERAEIQKQVNQAIKNGVAVNQAYDQTIVEYNGKTMTAAVALERLDSDITALGSSQADLNSQIEAQGQKIEEANVDLAGYDEVISKVTGSTNNSATAFTNQGTAAQNSAISAEGATAAFNVLMGAQAGYVGTTVEDILAMEETIKSSLESQMNMFEAFDGGVEISTSELLSNMQSQIDGVTNWEQNLITLADRGINQGLLQNLYEMGPQGANYVQAFANMTEAEFEEANRMWEQGMDIKGLSDSVGQDLINVLGGEIRDTGPSLYDDGYYTGSMVMAGASAGVESGRSALISTMNSVMSEAVSRVEKFLKIGSPSKLFEEIGEYTAEGFEIGFLNGKDGINNAVTGALDFGYLYDTPIGAGMYAPDISTAVASAAGARGDISIVVNAASGQSEEEIANIVMYRLQHEVSKREAVW